jgi:hypothetical protein
MDQRFARLLGLLLVSLMMLPAAAQAVEPDGALIRLTTNNWTYRIVGGAPLRITDCSYTNGCEGRKDVANLKGYRAYPKDSSIILLDGSTYRFAGGAPLWITTCNYAPTCAGRIQVDTGTWTDTAHYKAMPLDNTVIRNVNDGGYYRFAGGAPLLVRCDIGAGCTAPVMVDGRTLSGLGTPIPARPHMTQYPANGTTLVNADDNTRYRVAGRAPLLLPSTTTGGIIIDARTLVQNGTATAALPHLAAAPAEGTFLTAGGAFYRIAGGAAIQLTNCALLGNCAGAVPVDPATISGRAGGRLLPVPKDGTVLRGLPSNTLWEVVGGVRRQTFVNVAGISVDDAALAAIPLPAAPPTPAAPPPTFAPVISSGYNVNRRGTRLTSLKVRDAPVGSKVAVACNSRKRGCPFRSKSYTVVTARTKSVLGKFKNRRLKNKAVVTVKVTSPLGQVKYMTLRVRAKKLPVRSYRCAAPGAKAGKC